MSIINPDLLTMARTKMAQAAAVEKVGFVDPAAATGGAGAEAMAGPMAPMPAMGGGGDPMAAGGDPMAAGGDPMAAGGDPAAAGGDPLAGLMPMIQEAVSAAMVPSPDD